MLIRPREKTGSFAFFAHFVTIGYDMSEKYLLQKLPTTSHKALDYTVGVWVRVRVEIMYRVWD